MSGKLPGEMALHETKLTIYTISKGHRRAQTAASHRRTRLELLYIENSILFAATSDSQTTESQQAQGGAGRLWYHGGEEEVHRAIRIIDIVGAGHLQRSTLHGNPHHLRGGSRTGNGDAIRNFLHTIVGENQLHGIIVLQVVSIEVHHHALAGQGNTAADSIGRDLKQIIPVQV